MKWDWHANVLAPATVIFLSFIKYSLEIDCYVCSSFSQSDPVCEDPFDPISTQQVTATTTGNGSYIYLQRGCYGARKLRLTAFPATACLKLAGHFTDSGEKMVVRACALDGGSLTSDTEIVRQNHCGGFFLNERYVRGCLEACFTDGCNTASSKPAHSGYLLLAGALLTVAFVHFHLTGSFSPGY